MSKELTHWGILGMKWGRRRYQNEDGSLTSAGRERYGVGPPRDSNRSSSGSVQRRSSKAREKMISEEGVRTAYKNLSVEDQQEVLEDALQRIKDHDPDVYKDFTTDDLQALLTRRNLEKQLSEPDNDQNQQSELTKIGGKPLSQMTDKELQAELNRMQNEKKYLEATKKPSIFESTEKFMKRAKDVAKGIEEADAIIKKIKFALDERKRIANGDLRFDEMSLDAQDKTIREFAERVAKGDTSVYSKYTTDEIQQMNKRASALGSMFKYASDHASKETTNSSSTYNSSEPKKDSGFAETVENIGLAVAGSKASGFAKAAATTMVTAAAAVPVINYVKDHPGFGKELNRTLLGAGKWSGREIVEGLSRPGINSSAVKDVVNLINIPLKNL